VSDRMLRIIYNGDSIPLAEVPAPGADEFLRTIVDRTGRGWRISSFFGAPKDESVDLYCVLSGDHEGCLGIMRTNVRGAFPSITPECPQAHLFEREIAEQCAVRPDGHPWLKPARFHGSLQKAMLGEDSAFSQNQAVGIMDYFTMAGEEVHEVAVGPVHAGIIEPGHFRFQCRGEEVSHLEISLGYQHRGIEAGLIGAPDSKTICRMETIAGDTTIGHAEAYSMIMESLSGCRVPARGEALRGAALELERLANHTGDLGAIAGDVGYLPTSSFCGRIRGDFLNMMAVICGSRFGRGVVRPGGTGFDIGQAQLDELLGRLAAARKDLESAVGLLWSAPSVMARLENAGTVAREDAIDLGLVGPAARACRLKRDVRRDHPFGIYRMSYIPAMTADSGDVYARASVRWFEALRSLEFLDEQLRQVPGGACRNDIGPIAGGKIAVAMTEGWRGEICHVAITDDAGKFARYKITDPSFHNWMGLAMALRDEKISDFPLCNKSFNLSYCGFDL
jgi:Ni,Fe-hydrogenase III large subunit